MQGVAIILEANPFALNTKEFWRALGDAYLLLDAK